MEDREIPKVPPWSFEGNLKPLFLHFLDAFDILSFCRVRDTPNPSRVEVGR